MDKYTYFLIALIIIALLAIAFFAVFRGKGKVKVKAPLGVSLEAEGENPAPPSAPTHDARITDARSQTGGATAEARGGSATIERVVAHGDIIARTGPATEKPDPKPRPPGQ